MTAEHPEENVGVEVEFDVPAQMRDGVTLRANIYRPKGEGPWPTLLLRSPYGKEDLAHITWLEPIQTARKGFMIVMQDARGRFGSEGEWEPFRYERNDGYDSVEWAARLPGSNGRVGMYHASYQGSTQWLAAIEQPPSLGAIAPALTWSDPLDGLFARGGALELGLALFWDLVTHGGTVAKQPITDEERGRRFSEILEDFDELAHDGYSHLPVAENPILRRHSPADIGTFAMLSNPEVPDWSRVRGHHDQVTVPSLNIGGWYDIFLQGTLDNYESMAKLGRTTRLVIGPWTHYLAFTNQVGELSFGIRASRIGVPAHPEGDLNDVQLAWFRRHLSTGPVEESPESEAPVRIFVMGRNEWRDEESWPLERARDERWFLHADGTVGPEPPESGSDPTTFTYDPADPVPTHGGGVVAIPELQPGAFDQSRTEARSDVLVFSSKPLERDLEVTGRVRVILNADSSAPSTDWVARLCDVHPDGRSYNICDGIRRVAEGADSPGKIEVDLWSTSNVFLAGHRLRVQVTSSDFPRWDRNLNTGRQDESRIEVARQRLHHGPDGPCWIELPVVD